MALLGTERRLQRPYNVLVVEQRLFSVSGPLKLYILPRLLVDLRPSGTGSSMRFGHGLARGVEIILLQSRLSTTGEWFLSIWSRDIQRELAKGKVYSGYQAALTLVDPG